MASSGKPERGARRGVMLVSAIIFFAVVLSGAPSGYAASYTSTQSGYWGDANTWGAAGVPGPFDEVTVSSGTTVTVEAQGGEVGNLNVAGMLSLADAAASHDLTVNGVLTFTGGFITTGAGTLVVSGTGTNGPHTAGYVVGAMKKIFNGSFVTFRFDVGTASGYAPVATQLRGSGEVSVAARQGKRPDVGGAEALQRYWTVSGSGSAAFLNFAYNVSDVVGDGTLYKLYAGTSTPTPQSVNAINHVASVTNPNLAGPVDWTLAEPGAIFGRFQLSAATLNVPEGTPGRNSIVVNRVGGTRGPVTVDATTNDGTATGGPLCNSPGADYMIFRIPNTISLTFADGATSQTFDVPICDDNAYEQAETVNLALSNPTGGAVLGTPSAAVLTITDNDAQPTLSINDVSVSEPGLGTTQATFTVTLSGPSELPTTVHYQTTDGTAHAPGDYASLPDTMLTFNPLETSKQITTQVNADTLYEPGEAFFVQLSTPTNATIADAEGQGTISDPLISVGDVVISEFRLHGPAGAADQFVELYNNTDAPITVGTLDGSAGWSIVMRAPVTGNATSAAVLPNGTVLPARGHYLLTGSAYSLNAYAAPDQVLALPLYDSPDAGFLLSQSAADADNPQPLDAVGMGSAPAPFCEGATLSNRMPGNVEHSYVRRTQAGRPQDTNDNAQDFALVVPDAAVVPGAATLGAPAPENTNAPLQLNAQLKAALVEPLASAFEPPNRVRDLAPDACGGPNCAQGTLDIRRRFTNQTGRVVTALRFRVVDITTLGSLDPAGQADLRLLTSADSSGVPTSRGVLTLRGTVLETPPLQAAGGGLNSGVTVALPAGGLAAGETIDVRFLLGVERGGSYRVFVNVEALTTSATAPTKHPSKVQLR